MADAFQAGRIAVDLSAQEITRPNGQVIKFQIDPGLKHRLMEGLDPLERELLFLWAVEGYTARELGEATECSRGTVLSRLHRLRKKIIRHSQDSERRLQGGAAR